MTPIDYRNAQWEEIAARLDKNRSAVYHALQIHGPATTRELAAAMSWDVLNVRPRVTELFQLGFVEVVETEIKNEGTYRALGWTDARRNFERLKAAAQPKQLSFL
jgi:predicted transcriptional regulator